MSLLNGSAGKIIIQEGLKLWRALLICGFVVIFCIVNSFERKLCAKVKSKRKGDDKDRLLWLFFTFLEIESCFLVKEHGFIHL